MKPARLTHHRAMIATEAVYMLAAAGDKGRVVGSVVHAIRPPSCPPACRRSTARSCSRGPSGERRVAAGEGVRQWS
jgi:hypothetical protein